MNILVIGNGGREHALVWKLAQSPRVSTIYCAPGNAGIAELAECVPIKVDDLPGLQLFAKDNAIDLTIVGPELPLSLGIADEFRKAKLRIFGPTRNAARIESSKSFAKELMVRENIPTADSRTFDRFDAALTWLETCDMPLVVKADGLAQGKGVSKGTDTYVGMFKAGLPHGDGVYTWSTREPFEGKWKKEGVWNMEQFDPDPFMDDLNNYGLPWKILEGKTLES